MTAPTKKAKTMNTVAKLRTLSIRLLLLALTPLVPVGPARASEAIQAETRPLDPRGTVEISNVRGAIVVTVGDEDKVSLSGTLGADTKLTFDGPAGRVRIKAESTGSGGWFHWGGGGPSEDTRLEVRVPRAATLELSAVSADTRVRGISGSDSLQVESVSGDVDIAADTARLTLSSVSGDVGFTGRSPRSDIESVSGDLTLDGLSGELSLDTVSGDAVVRADGLSEVDLGSVSGDLRLSASLLGAARLSAESVSGDIDLELPADTSARVDAETFSGRLRSSFPLKIEDHDGPGSEMHGKLGDGDARIKLDTFSGDVNLRQRD